MAQKQRSTRRQQKSDFPVFAYLDMLMPHRLVSRFMEMPRHVRWTLISAVASLVILWVFLRVVVGSINYWIDTRGPFLKDALYLPYELTERPLPVYPEEVTEEDRFLLLPDTIAEQYVLQIPPTEEEIEATNEAELEAFLALSMPAEESLTALRDSLAERLGVDPEAVDNSENTEAASEVVATPVAADSEAVPTIAPTVDPVQLQLTAVDGVLTPLVTLNEALEDDDSIIQVFDYVGQLQNRLNSLVASGATMPMTVEPFKLRIDELAAMEPPVKYLINECLVTSKAVRRSADETFTLPCTITQAALFVERGEYIYGENNRSFDVTVTEFERPEDAARAIKELYLHGRTVGFTGDFAIEDTIEYNYFFSQAEGVYSLAWSHENWVYSISSESISDIDAMMKVFPY